MDSLDRQHLHHRVNHAVSGTTRLFGSLTAIALAAAVVVLWMLGAVFDVASARLITSMTTVVTFVMVFIIQSTHNRESRALQTKIDALLIATERLDAEPFLGLEHQPDGAIKEVQSEVHGSEPADPETADMAGGGPSEPGHLLPNAAPPPPGQPTRPVPRAAPPAAPPTGLQPAPH